MLTERCNYIYNGNIKAERKKCISFLREAMQLRSDMHEICISQGTVVTFSGLMDTLLITYMCVKAARSLNKAIVHYRFRPRHPLIIW